MMIQQASPVLYKATKDRAYFQSVHILVPASWNHIEANVSSWQIFEVGPFFFFFFLNRKQNK